MKSDRLARVVFHPYLLGIFPLIFLYAFNTGAITPGEVLKHVLGVTVLILVLMRVLSFFLKNQYRAGLGLSLFLILFFAYGQGVHLLEDLRFHLGRHEFGPNTVLYPLFALVWLSGLYLFKREEALSFWNRCLNLFSLFAVLVCLVLIVKNNLAIRQAVHQQTVREKAASEKSRLSAKGKRPDIYFIVLDGYSRADQLESMFGYDNSAFLKRLEEMGFYVAPKSTSNYPHTLQSVASTLHLDYLDDLVRKIGPEATEYDPVRNMFMHNKVFAFLKEQGYHTLVLSSPSYSMPSKIPADKQIYYQNSFTEYQNHLLNMTPLPALFRKFTKWGGLQYAVHRQSILYIFDRLEEIARQRDPTPKFVFVHLLAPHAPFVFDQVGNPVTPAGDYQLRSRLKGAAYIQSHNGQLAFINSKVEKVLDTILGHAATPPVILLESDHGHPFEVHELSYEANSDAVIRNLFSNLMAFYLPGDGAKALYSDMSPVNSFRIVFNRYFGTDYPLLEDRSFFSTTDQFYRFIDVSKKVGR